jgi:hypothetical protein
MMMINIFDIFELLDLNSKPKKNSNIKQKKKKINSKELPLKDSILLGQIIILIILENYFYDDPLYSDDRPFLALRLLIMIHLIK